jgi:hypothetical protein
MYHQTAVTPLLFHMNLTQEAMMAIPTLPLILEAKFGLGSLKKLRSMQ